VRGSVGGGGGGGGADGKPKLRPRRQKLFESALIRLQRSFFKCHEQTLIQTKFRNPETVFNGQYDCEIRVHAHTWTQTHKYGFILWFVITVKSEAITFIVVLKRGEEQAKQANVSQLRHCSNVFWLYI